MSDITERDFKFKLQKESENMKIYKVFHIKGVYNFKILRRSRFSTNRFNENGAQYPHQYLHTFFFYFGVLY